jgi:zinc/manganese transport system ATP-binding protein
MMTSEHSWEPDSPSSDRLLDVENVSVWLSGREVLHDVSFSIAPGEFTGLIGANGAGKTTLFRVVLGLQVPTSGQVLIDGRARARRSHAMGYVPQKILLDPEIPLRARDVVALGIDGNRFGIAIPSKTKRDAVEEMLDAVDALSFADARIGQLSGGEQQRVLIAHALVSRPRLLLLDEPLANLDLRSEHEVVGLLSKIASEQRIAVLISAHDMNPLLAAMDRIVYVAGGKAASGSTNEVVQSDVLSALYGHQVDVLRLNERVIVVAGAHPGVGVKEAGFGTPDLGPPLHR